MIGSVLQRFRQRRLDRRITDPILTEIEATFEPRDAEARARRPLWVVDDEDGGPFVGQHTWRPASWDDWTRFGGYWAPTEDLADVVVVRVR